MMIHTSRTGSCLSVLLFFTSLVALSALFSISGVAADKALVRGKDRVEVPAMGEGFCLHNLFQSNMVLQRDKVIRVWGWAEPGEKVTVSFGGREESVIAADDRSWTASLPAMPVNSTPAKMVVKGREVTLTLDNILVGDVWLLGGQSNMEHPISRIEDGDLEIVSANHPAIRILTVPSQNGPEKKKAFPRLDEWHGFFNQHYRKGFWDECTLESVKELSGIGYIFARRLHLATQVPIGVIDVSRGGTCVETWLPIETIRATDTPEVRASLAEWDAKVAAFDPQKDLEDRVRRNHEWVARIKQDGKAIPADRTVPTELEGGPPMDMNRPGNCYASMIAPLVGLAVKGAIWHQGYNNALQPEGHVMYYQLFGKMIESWRAAFNDSAMAFGIISMPTEGEPQTLENYTEMMVNEGPYIRHVQYRTFLDYLRAGDKQVGYASSYDMRRRWYHPQLKAPVGERIARWALATQYGVKIDWQPPMLADMKAGDGCITLTFDIQVTGLDSNPIEGFAIAGKDRRFHPATAEHLVTGKNPQGQPTRDEKTLVLTSPHVPDPVHFRYAWGRNPMGNLLPKFSQSRAPLATQRSDDWRIQEIPVPFGKTADRQAHNLAREAGRLIDMDRRVKNARQLLDEQQEKHTRELERWNARWGQKPAE